MARSRTARQQPQAEPDADLSEAARAVVHDAGDPRIDAHLAALGLGPEPSPIPARPAEPAADPAELQPLRDRVAELELHLAAVGSRTRLLTALLVVAGVVILVLGALQLL